MSSTSAKQLLIVGPSWVGDMVMAQSLFKVLRTQAHNVQIDVVAPGWSQGILARMPEVRRAFTLAAGHGELALTTRRTLGQQLQANGYDHAIVLPRSLKAALVPWFARVPVRTGFRGEWRYGLLTDLRVLDKQRYDQTIKRFVALGLPANAELPDIPAPALSIDTANQQRLIDTLGLKGTGGIAFMPGAAYGPAKMWPLEYFRDLAEQLSQQGRQVWILGGEKESSIAGQIAGNNPAILNLCGKTKLDETVDIFGLAAAAVTNDSGLMHVAAAAGTHVVAMYGSSSPAFTPPLTDKKTVLYLGLECSPCHKRTCPLEHLDCLRQIGPQTVMDALEPLLAG